MNISPALARRIAGWLRRVHTTDPAERDSLASTIHALDVNADAEERLPQK